MKFHTRATPKSSAAPALKNISPTYSPGIHGWDLWWLELLERLVAGGSSSSHHKSQPYIPGEYVGLVFLRAGAAELLGVALVSVPFGLEPVSTTHYNKIMNGVHFITCKGLTAKKLGRFNPMDLSYSSIELSKFSDNLTDLVW
jgi:hypothetical protein